MPGSLGAPGAGPGRAGRFWEPMPALGVSGPLGTVFAIVGVTRDSNGSALGGCAVRLFRTSDDVEVDRTTSDGSGNYSFPSVTGGQTYYVVAYLAGSPDVAGTTANTLLGAEVS